MSDSERVIALLGEWERWSAGADQRELGWETDFPQWDELASGCIQLMLSERELTADELSAVAFCWRASEESEQMADALRRDPAASLDLLRELAACEDARVRWQAYAVLGQVPPSSPAAMPAAHMLATGLEDGDAYCRRRALLALARVSPRSAPSAAQQLENDEDKLVREVAALVGRGG